MCSDYIWFLFSGQLCIQVFLFVLLAAKVWKSSEPKKGHP
jgi:hypothetical protein